VEVEIADARWNAGEWLLGNICRPEVLAKLPAATAATWVSVHDVRGAAGSRSKPSGGTIDFYFHEMEGCNSNGANWSIHTILLQIV